MKRILSVCALVSLLLAIAALSGCNETEYDFYSTISGTVYDAATGSTVQNASVVLTPSGSTQTTGEDGTFLFENLDPGQYTVTIQKEGYYVERKNVSALTGEDIQTDIFLREI